MRFLHARVLSVALLATLPWIASSQAAAASQPSKALVRPQGFATVPHSYSSIARSPRARALSSPQNNQAIQDPGFEAGSPWPAWMQSSSATPPRTLIDGSAPHSGSYGAHLCQFTNGCADQLSQGFTAPPRILSATLTFWFKVDTFDSTIASPPACRDYVAVGLVDTNGNTGANSGLRYCEDWGAAGYNQGTIDETGFLSAQAGRTVTLVGLGIADGSGSSGGPSDFHLDDFSLTITTAASDDAAYPYQAVSTRQYSLTGNDGSTWYSIDPTYLTLTVTPTAASTAVVSGNADLWTVNAGVNQDIGISVDGGAPAWKESGGNAGTFSPNAAFVQTVVPLTAGVAHTFQLQWKSNHVTSGTIVAGAGLGPIFSATRLSVQLTPSANVLSAMQDTQYRLDNSDGVNWQDLGPGVDPTVPVAPASDGTAIVNANVDLWTATAGYNQDIGIFESVNSNAYQLLAWKESGGFAGTFSPNAAFVQATTSLVAGNTYSFKLQWKTNKRAPGSSIFASAGPAAPYSPTRLTVQLYPGGVNLQDAVSTSQYQMNGSDGASWVDIDPALLSLSLSAQNNCVAILSANADLWTTRAGYNQDIGIQVSTAGATFSPSQVGWKESGGFAGTFSPNAAFVQSIFPMAAGTQYTARLQWKTNRPSPANASILAAAGLSPNFSPTRLTAQIACPSGAKLAFATAPQTITHAVRSAPIGIQLQDRYGSPVNASGTGQLVTLQSSSVTGSFTDVNGAPIVSVTIPAGSNTASFEYLDSVAGTPTLTVSAAGLASATQQETVS